MVLDRHSEELLKLSGQVELDFMSWLDVSEEDANWSVDRDCAGKNPKDGIRQRQELLRQ